MLSSGPMKASGLRLCACVLFLLVAAAALAGADASTVTTEPIFSAGGGPVLPLAPERSAMTTAQGALLGLIEGLTEFLPVSSHGHLAVARSLMGLTSTPEEKLASEAYAICIQAGAIIAILLVCFARIRAMARGIVGRDREGVRLLGRIAVAFVPAALIGLLLGDRIAQSLHGTWPIAAAWLVGGIFILGVLARPRPDGGKPLEGLSWESALIIGLAQVVALWPGVGRSLALIGAALLLGLSASAAVEFSFLLGLFTLGAATVQEGIRHGQDIVRIFGWVSPSAGLVIAGLSAFGAARWLMDYLRERSLAVFGWYRIGIAVFVGALAAMRIIAA